MVFLMGKYNDVKVSLNTQVIFFFLGTFAKHQLSARRATKNQRKQRKQSGCVLFTLVMRGVGVVGKL